MMVFVIGAFGDSVGFVRVCRWRNPGGAQQLRLLFTNPLGFGIKDLLEENAHDKKGQVTSPWWARCPSSSCSRNLLSVFPAFFGAYR